MAPLIFICYFNLILRFLKTLQIPSTAFVDDLTCLLSPDGAQEDISKLQGFLSDMGLRVNVSKTVILPTRGVQPFSLTMLSLKGITPIPWDSHVLHLGHPLTSDLDPVSIYRRVANELETILTPLHGHPLPSLHRITVANALVLPLVLYRLECTPPMPNFLTALNKRIVDFILAVAGIPLILSPKTLFSKASRGMGLRHLPTLQPTRLLDGLCKSSSLLSVQPAPSHALSPYRSFLAAKTLLYRMVPENSPVQAPPPPPDLPSPTGIMSVGEYMVATLTLPNLEISSTECFTDGSMYPNLKISGGAALSSPNTGLLARTPGKQTSYRGELLGLYIASHVCPPGTTLVTDCAGALNAVMRPLPPVQSADLLHPIRSLVKSKGLQLQKVKAHATNIFNNLCDLLAKAAAFLPPHPAAVPSGPWDVIHSGCVQRPPHKTWTHTAIPSHAHEGIHPCSFQPLKLQRMIWFKWIFGLHWSPGYSAYTTFWKQTVPCHPCPLCRHLHNQSIHGVLAFCLTHPLHQAWKAAWSNHPAVLTWHHQAIGRDKWLVGKAVIPTTLYEHLFAALGAHATRSLIRTFQRKFPSLVAPAMESPPPSQRHCGRQSTLMHWVARPPATPSLRKRPFHQDDWMAPPGPPPSHLTLVRKRHRVR